MNILLFVFQVVVEFVSSSFFSAFFYLVLGFGILIMIIVLIRRLISSDV